MSKKIKYVDMAIYIDSHVYDENKDEEKIFNYLQELFHVLSYKKKFFNNNTDYYMYSMYSAGVVYMRLTNPRQFLPDDDPKKLVKIKSSLNFIKKLLYPLKIEYKKDYFQKVLDDNIHDKHLCEGIKNVMKTNIKELNNPFIEITKEDYLQSIPKTIKKFLNTLPYSNNKVFLNNLYISCLLSLLNNLTLSEEDIEKYNKRNLKFPLNADKFIENLYQKEMKNKPILFHIDESYSDYIYVLLNEIKDLIIKDMQQITKDFEPSDELLENILIQPLSDLKNKD